MLGTEELWDAYFTELEFARFALIASNLVMEEMPKIVSKQDAKDYKRRFYRHIRASNRHTNKANRIYRKIMRIEKRDGKRHQSRSSG